ncbi:Acetylcholine receptor subunit alpha-1-A [Mizuhopecten yessoensis]|uniref:Acetylcholine receptor subunit alpha-1-A n=1 Tax=Mizuhopecten yessoensis TaxID=6573 RepID=A0A210QGV1_MIZYE|nr:Acetylcholine receptor subunit alpha-1-A [Mizuhopecten yessoensis]
MPRFSLPTGRSDIPEEDILDDLFYSYNKHARPSLGPLHTVTVSHSLTLTRIVSMEKHVLTADTWQMMKWQDSRLTWDPDDYAQVKNINIPDELVWTPDIVLYNNAAATSGKMYASIRVVVDMSGNAVWIPGTRVTAYCEEVTSSDRADISAGDFKCPLKFGSWTYHKKSLNMTIAGDGLLMSDYIKSPQYEIIDYEYTIVTCGRSPIQPPTTLEVVELVSGSQG